jgi:acyl-coenzyme A thioesterase PaaI-like protein
MGDFREATAVRRVGEGRYAAQLDADYGFQEALHGGYLMAVLTRAALDASDHRHPIATSTNFLRVAQPGPAEVHVERRKSGRTADVARVTLLQDDRAVVEAVVTSGTLDGDSEPAYSAGMDRLPPLGECVGFGDEDASQGFVARVEMLYDPATMGWLDGRPSGVPEIRAYLRLRDASAEHEPDGALLALAVDALPPVALNVGAGGWAPTVELTWYMRAVPAPGWLALSGRGRLVNDGWFDEEVEVWDSAGRLVAQSRQIARVGRKTR